MDAMEKDDMVGRIQSNHIINPAANSSQLCVICLLYKAQVTMVNKS
jgi:hypothetical protein